MKFTIQIAYALDRFGHVVIEADTPEAAMHEAIRRLDEDGYPVTTEDLESSSSPYIADIVEGEHQDVYDEGQVHREIPPEFTKHKAVSQWLGVELPFGVDALVRELIGWNAEAFDNDTEIDGADAVDFLADIRLRLREKLIEKPQWTAFVSLANPEAQFRNRLRILRSIDRHEIPGLEIGAWRRFVDDPFEFLIRADDEQAALIWDVVRKREAAR